MRKLRATQLGITQEEAHLLLDAVVDRYLKQKQHIAAQERPSERAWENLDILSGLKNKLRDIYY